MEHLERALQGRQKVLHAAHPDTIDTMTVLGKARASFGMHQDAVAHFRQAVELLEQSQGPEHPRTLEAIHVLGLGLRGSGDYDGAAEQLQRRAAAAEGALLLLSRDFLG